MEETPENGKESSHSAHASGMNETFYCIYVQIDSHVHNWQKQTVGNAKVAGQNLTFKDIPVTKI